MKVHITRRTSIGFCIALSILIGLGLYAYVNSNRLISAGQLVSHTNEVLYLTEQVLSAQVDMEISQRGYTITGDSAFLDPYINSVNTIQGHLDDLLLITLDNAAQQEKIQHLKKLANKKKDFSQRALLARNQGFENSKNIIASMEGKILMDSIRKVIARIENVEKELLAQREENNREEIRNFRLTYIILIAITILVLIGVFLNINYNFSKRIAAEGKLAAANNELEAFTYSVSHDLRAPLRSIDGYARILKEDYSQSLDNEGDRVIGVIQNNAKRMGQLIDDMLEFSRVGRKEISKLTVNMEDLVHALVRDIELQGEAVNVEFKIGQIHSAEADINMIRQVWLNLLSNAIKYSSKNPKPRIEINSVITGNEIWYSVKDNGVGFDMQYVHKLFSVFQRLHKINEFEGTGVGLAIVKRIATRHGGNVYAEGRLNEGATFYFTIPQ